MTNEAGKLQSVMDEAEAIRNRMRYKKLDLHVDLPEELEADIDRYIEYLNSSDNHSLADCYQMEIQASIGYCIREDLLDGETIRKLREYYLWGGIHEQIVKDTECYSDR